MKKKYDWIKLKNDFVTGKYLTITDFFISKNVKNNSRSRINAKGWIEDRKSYNESVLVETKGQILESEVDIRLRQREIAKKLQEKGLEALNRLEVNNPDDARKMITGGLEQEREALGLDNKHISATQVNFNVGRTNWDEKIEKMDYSELLQFIAEIKREKERRSKDNILVTKT